jgi:hypothetical protein
MEKAGLEMPQWAAEGGIPFFAMMLAIAGWTIRPAVRSLWGIGLVTIFVQALIDYSWQRRLALAAFFFALLGLLAGEIRYGSHFANKLVNPGLNSNDKSQGHSLLKSAAAG